jgi:regulator of RNase E activity RraA
MSDTANNDEVLSAADRAELEALDTPTVCNAIELVVPERRSYGFTTKTLNCVRPELGSMVGVARTVTVRSTRPSALDPVALREHRFGYYDYVAEANGPTISIVQDLDDGQAGFGSFWGEVNSNIHWSLGCIGTVTNGSVRDVGDLADGFQVLSGVIAPSHGFIHAVDYDCEVNIAGMVVQSRELIHADRHGAVVIPAGKAREVIEAAGLMARREAVVLEAAKAGAGIEAIKQAMIASAKIT